MNLLAFVGFLVVMLTLMPGQTSGQSYHQLHIDRPAVPLGQMADVILVLVPDERYDLLAAMPHERVIRGSIVRLEKGPMPPLIVHTANSFTNPLEAGVPVRLFLMKFKDRDAHYIIGVHPVPE